MNGRYLWWEAGKPAGGETFKIQKEAEGARVQLERRSPDGGVLALNASFDNAWRIVRLELERDGRSATYGWDGDTWVGRIRGGAETAIPMAGELDADCTTAFFDLAFLARAALPPLSQRRIELLRVRPDTFETEQSHQIVERIPDATLDWNGVPLTVRCYRLTDDLGRQELIWTREDGLCLRRAAADGSSESYRLVDDAQTP